MTGTDTLFPDSSCPAPYYLGSAITGTGTATHLGRFTAILHDCAIPFEFGFLFQDGAFTAVAADGSELQGTYEGQLVATPTSAVDGVFQIEGTYTITGGTRRFQGASGSGVFTGTDNLATHAVTLSLTGTLTP